MSLHGGGIRFVADRTVADLAGTTDRRQSVGRLKFHAPVGVPDLDRGATLTLERRVEPDEPDVKRWVLAASDLARNLMNQQDLPLSVATSAGAGALRLQEAERPAETDPAETEAVAPITYIPIVLPDAEAEPMSDALINRIVANTKEPSSVANSGQIPAVYTYFGQFLAHDITFMHGLPNADTTWNMRTHALDLDSLFGALPEGSPVVSAMDCIGIGQSTGLCLGSTTQGALHDIPRRLDGSPALADPRNGNNLSVSQLTVALVRFLRRLQTVRGHATLVELKLDATRHVQSIVLNDYLPMVCDNAVLAEINALGRKVIFPGAVPPFFQVSPEFAVGCFRFGHSMVNSSYPWNAQNPQSSLYQLLNLTHLGVGLQWTPGHRLPDDWIVDWSMFADPATKARAIDCMTTNTLHNLQGGFVDQGSDVPAQANYSLAYLTLLRARQLGLATGQQLVGSVRQVVQNFHTPAEGPNDLFPANHPVCAGITAAERDFLNTRTPLWLYTLREAELAGTGRLGPLGSRIVAETIMASIQAVPGGLLDPTTSFSVPTAFNPAGTDVFTLQMLFDAISSNN